LSPAPPPQVFTRNGQPPLLKISPAPRFQDEVCTPSPPPSSSDILSFPRGCLISMSFLSFKPVLNFLKFLYLPLIRYDSFLGPVGEVAHWVHSGFKEDGSPSLSPAPHLPSSTSHKGRFNDRSDRLLPIAHAVPRILPLYPFSWPFAPQRYTSPPSETPFVVFQKRLKFSFSYRFWISSLLQSIFPLSSSFSRRKAEPSSLAF